MPQDRSVGMDTSSFTVLTFPLTMLKLFSQQTIHITEYHLGFSKPLDHCDWKQCLPSLPHFSPNPINCVPVPQAQSFNHRQFFPIPGVGLRALTNPNAS